MTLKWNFNMASVDQGFHLEPKSNQDRLRKHCFCVVLTYLHLFKLYGVGPVDNIHSTD